MNLRNYIQVATKLYIMERQKKQVEKVQKACNVFHFPFLFQV